MSESKKVTRRKSIYGTIAGIFRKKKKESDSSSSKSQGQINGASIEGPDSQGTSKGLRRDIYRKVNNADATSYSEMPSTSSIDPAHVSTTVKSGDDQREKSIKTTRQITEAVNAESNRNRSDKVEAASSNSSTAKPHNEAARNIFTETELIETLNKDLRISKLKINNSDSKIVINQIDNGVKEDSNSEKGKTAGELGKEKISSEIMKRKWFNNEIVKEVSQAAPVLTVATKKESTEKIPIIVPEFEQIKTKEIVAATDAILKEEKHVKVERNKKDSSIVETQMLIEVEKKERNPDNDYFTTGKYASYFFLEIEKQYHDPGQVYSMVRYRDPEDSDDSDSEGENSSSESTSPNIPSTMRRRLMHRRSADNLMVNSPTNSMRHSSPESVKSAPIQLKPRSTSHDALSKKKDKQGSQTDGVSMDSLAKQALLAARVLNLIPAQQARDRNFLHGRVATNSLLGPVELEKVLPNREIKIFIGTWNMNGQPPPKELNDFMLPSGLEAIPEMLAIGTQESYSEKAEWEAALQETLGPSHVLLTSTSLGTLHLALFVRRDLIWFCSVPEDSNFSTRTGTAFRTKGAVALAIMLFGTSFLFVTAHLTAHQDKVKERVNDIKRIVRNLDLPKDLPTKNKSKDVTQNFDCVFWCGDLNFRLAQPREEVVQWISNTEFPHETPINLNKDQLRTTLNEGLVLRGFQEAAIMFPPTYKYDPGSQNFDSSSKQRTPAYTDRILFKGKGQAHSYIRSLSTESSNSQKDGVVECLIYDSVPSICTSDHKPVWGVFRTTVRPGIDTIPLAAGLFNREIYLEGIKRRAAAMDDSYGMSRKISRKATP